MSILLLFAVLVLVILNGFFVAAEFALVRSRRGTLEAEAEEGKRGARAAVHVMDDLSRYLSSCQLGITLASLGIGFLGEPAIAELVKPAFEGLSHAVAARPKVARQRHRKRLRATSNGRPLIRSSACTSIR